MLSIQKNKKHLDFFGKVYYNMEESRGESAFLADFYGLGCICLNAYHKRNVSFLCSLLIKCPDCNKRDWVALQELKK